MEEDSKIWNFSVIWHSILRDDKFHQTRLKKSSFCPKVQKKLRNLVNQ